MQDIINAVIALVTEDRKWRVHSKANVSDWAKTIDPRAEVLIAKICRVTTQGRPYPKFLNLILDGSTIRIGNPYHEHSCFDLNNPNCFEDIKKYLAQYD